MSTEGSSFESYKRMIKGYGEEKKTPAKNYSRKVTGVNDGSIERVETRSEDSRSPSVTNRSPEIYHGRVSDFRRSEVEK